MRGKGATGKVTKSKKKTISLKTKLDILQRFDEGEKAVEIAKAVGLAATTVRTIRDRDGDKIREAAKSATSLDAKTITRRRSALMIKMESLLSIWIEKQVAEGVPLSKMIIQAKAKSLFDDLKSKTAASNDNASGSKSKNETFEASQGWFERFKVRANLQSIALKGKACGADITAAECSATELKTLNHKGGYEQKQVFNVDETGLFWKRLPKRTFVSKTEKSGPGLKASKDELTLLGDNTNGDFKFKPFTYHSENPTCNQESSTEELSQMELDLANERGDSDISIEIPEKQNLTPYLISKATCLINEGLLIFLKNDPDCKRSVKVSRAVTKEINCYNEILITLKQRGL